MNNSKRTNEKLNILGNYKRVRRDINKSYKSEYNRISPTKISSSSFLELYTLFLLNKSAEPLYGKEILREIQRDVGTDIWKPSHGTFYPLLQDMVLAGYIKIINTASSMKFYTITELGAKELEVRLREFKPILMHSAKFFSTVLARICNRKDVNAIVTDILSPEANSEGKF